MIKKSTQTHLEHLMTVLYISISHPSQSRCRLYILTKLRHRPLAPLFLPLVAGSWLSYACRCFLPLWESNNFRSVRKPAKCGVPNRNLRDRGIENYLTPSSSQIGLGSLYLASISFCKPLSCSSV